MQPISHRTQLSIKSVDNADTRIQRSATTISMSTQCGRVEDYRLMTWLYSALSALLSTLHIVVIVIPSIYPSSQVHCCVSLGPFLQCHLHRLLVQYRYLHSHGVNYSTIVLWWYESDCQSSCNGHGAAILCKRYIKLSARVSCVVSIVESLGFIYVLDP